MPIRRFAKLTVALRAASMAVATALPLGLAALQPLAAAETASRAQTEIFATPHLDNVTAPLTLRYAFHRGGSAVETLDDRVDLIVTEVTDEGRKNLSVRFLSGDNQRAFPPLEGFRGNPLVMLFLEHEVERLARETGGSTLYFRNRIREAIALRGEVEEVALAQGGGSVPARRVTLEPFVADPMIDRFPRYRHQHYEFLLADAVPGGIERIVAVLPGPEGGPPVVEQSVTFVAAEP